MHHPGPPRFTTVGRSIELAPRDPDPTATYRWRLESAPSNSTVALEDGPVIHFSPDTTGTYLLTLAGPNGTHTQTVRVFEDDRQLTTVQCDIDEFPLPATDIDSVSAIGAFNDHFVGADRPARTEDAYVLECMLAPGEHTVSFCPNDDLSQQVRKTVTVPGPGRPRISLSGAVTGDSITVTATPTAPYDSKHDDESLSVEWFSDDRNTVAADILKQTSRTVEIKTAELSSEPFRLHAVAVGERHSVADTIVISVTDSGAIDIDRPNEPPTWARSPTVYEIFVRSFAGETLQTTFSEIERRVAYLESLNIDMLWLTPVLESPTRHGYHITDFFTTASDLGTRAAFESLVDRCHDAGIKVVFDLVINHSSRDHPAFQLYSAGVDSYSDYYRRMPAAWDTTGVSWAGEDSPEFYFTWQRIPNLNYDSLAVRQWMLDVVDEWATVVDGFRCDVAWGVSHGFWKEVRDRVSDNFLLLDETIPRDPFYHENEFHMHYDTTLYDTLLAVGSRERPATAIFDALANSRWQGFPGDSVHLRYVENHDEDRYIAECGEQALRAAVGTIFTLPGAPMIYYGQERGMTAYRGPMKWHDGDAELTQFHRRLTTLRSDHPALASGELTQISPTVHSGEPAAVIAYTRSDETESYVVVCNFATDTATVTLPVAVDTTDLVAETAVEDGDAIAVDDIVILEQASSN
ncbi:DUF3459 domain-containing protein [Halorubraceae archaeon YAN]|nr:DUF3459 domain-containing protein [Halorubraceae archaeon YAN]